MSPPFCKLNSATTRLIGLDGVVQTSSSRCRYRPNEAAVRRNRENTSLGSTTQKRPSSASSSLTREQSVACGRECVWRAAALRSSGFFSESS